MRELSRERRRMTHEKVAAILTDEQKAKQSGLRDHRSRRKPRRDVEGPAQFVERPPQF